MGTARTDYWYDSTGMSLETSATGGGNATYLREPGGGLVSVTSGTRFQNHFTDRQGTVTATVNGYGNLVNTYRYDPYGSSVGTTGTVYNEYRYAGTYREPALGMYLMGARYYQPTTGRFTQADPRPSSVFEANRYIYTYGDPANQTDKSGLEIDEENVSPGATSGVVAGGGTGVPPRIYRAGSETDNALAPRVGESGLSFRSSLSNPYPMPSGARPVFRVG